MAFKLKSLITSIATIGLIASGLATPASAAAETFDLQLNDSSLIGSTISGYDPTATLRVAIIASMGKVNWSNNGSGAVRLGNLSGAAQGIWLEGTQDQLNAALGEFIVTKPCSGSYKLYGQVSTEGIIKNPETGHIYKAVTASDTFLEAKAHAEATPFTPGGTDTFGYLATITDPLENIIVSNLINNYGYIGGTDSIVEGDWTWVGGPEKDQVFYRGRGDQGGVPVNAMFNNWAYLEPNDYNNAEDQVEVLSDGRWNDIGEGARNYTIEWGGMPGDNVSSAVIAEDEVSVSVAGVLTGAGTEADPYLVPDVAGLSAVASCAAESAYFKQTSNITLPNNWPGNQVFEGHYDGNGKTISFSANTPTHNDFGVWSRAGVSAKAYIHDLAATGDLDATGVYRVGLLVGQSTNVEFNKINVSGTLIAGGDAWGVGGVSGVHYNGTLDFVSSTVDIHFLSENYAVGGIAGEMNGTIYDSTWSGEITSEPGVNFYGVGGLAGYMDCGQIYDSAASGTITSTGGQNVGGLVGYSCGGISTSSSSVDVSAPDANNVGGLIGTGDCTEVSRSWATGNVTGAENVGGLAGYSCGEFNNVYARGSVTATDEGGSLIGNDSGGYMNRAYATGVVTVTNGTSRGAFGASSSGSWYSVHWNPTQSTIVEPTNLQNGEIPFTDLQAKNLAYYTAEGWDMSANFEDEPTWLICSGINGGYPFLNLNYSSNPCAEDQVLKPTPAIIGTGAQGSRLNGKPGTWDSGTTLTYEWLRDGQVIANATASTYTPVAGDVGKTITFKITSTKAGFKTATASSLGKVITGKKAPVTAQKSTQYTFGEFAGNSWWIPTGFVSAIKSAVKAQSKATSVTCVGIVAPGGSKAWQKTLGLKRAELACSTAKLFNSKLKTKLTWQVSTSKDKVRRGATLKFSN